MPPTNQKSGTQVGFNDLEVGSEFDAPLRLPRLVVLPLIISWLGKMFGHFGLRLQPYGPKPFMFNNVITSAQVRTRAGAFIVISRIPRHTDSSEQCIPES